MAKSYWMIVLSPENFDITRKLGFKSQGLKAYHRRKVQRVGPGDRLVFYLSHKRCFTATATVTSQCSEARELPWVKEGKTPWAYMVDIQPNVVLEPDEYMDAGELAPRLDYVRKWIPEDWYMAFQDHLHLLPKKDFQLIEQEMQRLTSRRHRRGGSGQSDGVVGATQRATA